METSAGIKLSHEFGGKIAILTVDRPGTRNSMDIQTFEALANNLEEQDRDPGVRVIILTGGGEKVFISGLDIRQIKDFSPLQYRSMGEKQIILWQKILGLSKPVIAMVNGHALGGGCAIALTSDLIIASDKAKFGLPEINLGLLGGMHLMVHLVGRIRAAELCFTGRTLSAQEAFSLGLVNRVVPPGNLREMTISIAQDVAKKSPIALKFAKKALRTAFEEGPRFATMNQLDFNSLCFSSEDLKEGIQAFLEKREPMYSGK